MLMLATVSKRIYYLKTSRAGISTCLQHHHVGPNMLIPPGSVVWATEYSKSQVLSVSMRQNVILVPETRVIKKENCIYQYTLIYMHIYANSLKTEEGNPEVLKKLIE